ncbi:hypothetical protein B0J13DRAFT_520199 [Dactylonectria estremocensis]|uniref:Secreted protein n=1 Tax=Dactylonectria estremocensis TaxID=1079267 RepID=A0A9P9FCT6_9HYPO|nr:hypothetical protein B0J13DRAFT_520199 [Dactylonectria estremocensis]
MSAGSGTIAATGVIVLAVVAASRQIAPPAGPPSKIDQSHLHPGRLSQVQSLPGSSSLGSGEKDDSDGSAEQRHCNGVGVCRGLDLAGISATWNNWRLWPRRHSIVHLCISR